MSASVRPIDEVGNNVANPTWGTANIDLGRLAAAAYGDGISSPALSGNLSARAISNLLNNQADPANSSADIATIDQNGVSDFGYAFGQFMDHDLDLTPDGGESLPIAVAANDPIGPNALPFTRSLFNAATGTSKSNPRQQTTVVTSYLDLSNVYGSSQNIGDALRTFSGGLLKTSPGNMLPYASSTYFTPAQLAALNMANDSQMVSADKLFAAGDRRANENLELTVLQTLFLRNHNRIAAKLKAMHGRWSDETIYQRARKINIAQYQNIVYREWIPAVLGEKAIPRYRGYNAAVNATISNEFSTVAFRMGHSMLSADIERDNSDGSPISDPTGDSAISLAQDFFDPNLLNPAKVIDPFTGHVSSDIGPVLKAMGSGDGQAMDLMAVGDVRNLLFGNGAGGEDLMARDVQRDRDNGIPDYNSLRIALGLPAAKTFADITSNLQAQQALAAAYPGGVGTVDAFEGGLAEDHVKGSDVGPLFQAIMVDQFARLRDGDRFFYQNENFTSEERSLFAQGDTLAKVIEANSDAQNLQGNVLYFKASISGHVMIARKHSSAPRGLAGVVVQLENADGDLVARTVTRARGRYTFSQFSTGAADPSVSPGLSASGIYHVSIVMPASLHQAVLGTAALKVSAGTVLKRVNLTLA